MDEWNSSNCYAVEYSNAETEKIDLTCCCSELLPTTIVNDVYEVFETNPYLKRNSSNDVSKSYNSLALWVWIWLTVIHLLLSYYGIYLDRNTEQAFREATAEKKMFVKLINKVVPSKSSSRELQD